MCCNDLSFSHSYVVLLGRLRFRRWSRSSINQNSWFQTPGLYWTPDFSWWADWHLARSSVCECDRCLKSSLSAQQTGEALHKHKSIYHLAARYLQSFPQCARDLRLIYGPFRCRNRNARHCPHTSMCPSGWHESNQSERHFSFATVRVAFNFRPVPSQLLCSNCSSLCNIIQIKQFCRY